MGGQLSTCHSCRTDLIGTEGGGGEGGRRPRRESFPDLAQLPPEVAVEVLSHLNATDLCLASCVNDLWASLANVDVLWKR